MTHPLFGNPEMFQLESIRYDLIEQLIRLREELDRHPKRRANIRALARILIRMFLDVQAEIELIEHQTAFIVVDELSYQEEPRQ